VRRVIALLHPTHVRASTKRMAFALLALGILPLSTVSPAGLTTSAAAAAAVVERAACSPGDLPEPLDGLQGQVTLAQRFAFAGASCNLSVVGAFPGPGSTWVGAALGDCAYYPTLGDGVLVVDVSDPRHPRQTDRLRSPGMRHTWESLKANAARSLLAATAVNGNAFDVYDIRDCRHPRLLASVGLPDVQGHEGAFSPDGLTYYVTNRGNRTYRDFGFLPVDLTDPTQPQPMTRWDTPGWGTTHGLSLSPDGRRMYLTVPNGFERRGSGVAVLDVSSIQRREPVQQVRVLSTLGWYDGDEAQMTLPLAVDGRPHLLVVDEKGGAPVAKGPGACRDTLRGAGTFGFPRILDVSDEAAPRQVAAVRLQVQDPRNCSIVVHGPTPVFSYSSHYCSVDRTEEPRLLACATFGAGVRVFDIRDLDQLREVAYYNPAPRSGTHSQRRLAGDRGVDWASSPPVFRLDRGELWEQYQDNGLLVMRFSPAVLDLLQ
jgi:hypothetical protein